MDRCPSNPGCGLPCKEHLSPAQYPLRRVSG